MEIRLCSCGKQGTSHSEGVASSLLVGLEPRLVSRAGREGGQSGTCLSLAASDLHYMGTCGRSWHSVLQTCTCTCTELEEGKEGDSVGSERLWARLLLPGHSEGEWEGQGPCG